MRSEDEETVSKTLPGSRKHTSRQDRWGPIQSAYRPYEPKELATCRSEGWKKDTHRIYRTHLSKTSPHITPTKAEMIIEPVLEHMWNHRSRWYYLKENDLVAYGAHLNDFFQEVHGYRLLGLDSYIAWIKPGSWYHKSVLENEQLNHCPHLMHTPPPAPGVDCPSESTLHSHQASYEQALAKGSDKQIAKWRKTYGSTLHLHGLHTEAMRVDPLRLPPGRGSSEGGAPQRTTPMEVDQDKGGTRSPSKAPQSRSQQQTQTPSPTGCSSQKDDSAHPSHSQGGGNAPPHASVSWVDQVGKQDQEAPGRSPSEWQEV